MSAEEIDTEVLIHLVKSHAVIWNVSSPLFKDRLKKDAAWEQICGTLVEDFAEKEVHEKKEIVRKITARWKNVKDTFVKSQRKRTRSGQPASKTKNYIYAKYLSFLEPYIGTAATESIIEVEEGEDVDNLNTEESSSEPLLQTTGRANTSVNRANRRFTTTEQHRKDIESSVLKFMSQPIVVEPPDEDRAFFDSLLPTVKSFTCEQKFEYRMEILNVTRRYKLGTDPQQFTYPPIQQHNFAHSQSFSSFSQPNTSNNPTFSQPSTSSTVLPSSFGHQSTSHLQYSPGSQPENIMLEISPGSPHSSSSSSVVTPSSPYNHSAIPDSNS